MVLDHDSIRRHYATGKYSQRALARQFGCDKSSIGRIVGSRVITRRCVRIVSDPTELFSSGASFRMGDLVFGAIEKEGLEGIVWADGTVFEIVKNGVTMRASCVDGKIVREDGMVLKPGGTGKAEWEPAST